MLLATSIAAVVWIVCLSWLDKMQPNMFDKLQLLLSYRISVDYSYSCMSKLDNSSKQSAVIKSDVTNINILPLNIIGDWSRLEPNFAGIFHRMRIKLACIVDCWQYFRWRREFSITQRDDHCHYLSLLQEVSTCFSLHRWWCRGGSRWTCLYYPSRYCSMRRMCGANRRDVVGVNRLDDVGVFRCTS